MRLFKSLSLASAVLCMPAVALADIKEQTPHHLMDGRALIEAPQPDVAELCTTASNMLVVQLNGGDGDLSELFRMMQSDPDWLRTNGPGPNAPKRDPRENPWAGLNVKACE